MFKQQNIPFLTVPKLYLKPVDCIIAPRRLWLEKLNALLNKIKYGHDYIHSRTKEKISADC